MKGSTRRLLYWTPRILTILFAIFISLFAMDVFFEGYSRWQMVVALFMHLIPTFAVITVLVISWRWEWVGAVLFVALGILYLAMLQREADLIAYFVIPGPLFLVGALFGVNWLLRRRLRARAT